MNTRTKQDRRFTKRVKPLVTATALVVGGLALALTEAGTVIKNLATVTYTSGGEEYIATSNEAQVTVDEVFEALLTTDNSVLGEVGDTVYLPHTITNIGNAPDTYTITETTTATGIATFDPTTVYVDTNGNGQVDPGEPTLAALGGVTPEVAPGETLQLIVAVDVTAGADNDTVQVDLVAVSVGDVTQVLDDNADGTGGNTDGNNEDLVTLTSAAILEPSKESSFVGNTLTYTLTVENTGGAAAAAVQIFDVLPAGTDNTTFNIVSVTPSVATGGTIEVWDDATTLFVALADELTDDFDEPATIDMNGDGTVGELLIPDGFLIQDTGGSLPAGESIVVVYTVDILAANAADTFKNIFCAATNGTGMTGVGDQINLGSVPNECSNQTIDRADPDYSVQITDTQDITVNGTNDATGGAGTDDDGIDNDVQYIDEADMTDVLEYILYVKNNGNRDDFMDIAVSNDGTFPDNTVFTFWNETGNVPLADNNNNGSVDAGLLAPGEDVLVVVKVHLPVTIAPAVIAQVDISTEAGAGVILAAGGADLVLESGDYFLDVDEDNAWLAGGSIDGIIGNDAATEFDDASATQLNDSEVFAAAITITSAANPAETDSVVVALGKIVAIRFDLANSEDASVVPDFTSRTLNAHDGGTIITVGNNDFADNFDESGSDDPSPVNSGHGLGDDEVKRGDVITFPLFVRNNGAVSDTFDLTAADDAAGGAEVTIDLQPAGGGGTITDTGVLLPGAVFAYQAVVTVDGTAIAGTVDLTFTAESAASSSGATDLIDTKVDAIIIEVAQCIIQVSGAAPLELAAGATVDYTHTVTNDFNLPVIYTFTSTISEFETAGWTTELRTAAGAALLSTLDEDGGTAGVQITVTAGNSLTFVQRLEAPGGADIAETAVGTVVIDADNGNCTDEFVIDEATITIDGVQIVKSVANDDDCNCVADGLYSTDAGTKQPGACVVWRLTATNSSGADATNVVIRDPLSQFTAYQVDGTYDGTLPGYTNAPAVPASANQFKACSGTVGAGDCDATPTLANVTDGGGIGANGGSLTITNGQEAAFNMGTLLNAEQAVAEICVQVQ